WARREDRSVAPSHREDRCVPGRRHRRRGAQHRLDRADPLPWAAYNRVRSHPCQNSARCKSLFLKSPHPLVLASTSRYRRALLERLKLPFTTSSPGVDETREAGERPLALATRLALAKAAAVAAREPSAWVIGSDQVAVRLDVASGESVLGKPG